MKFYADTSLLISYYINESNSARAQSLIHATAGPLPFTGLHRLEMRNALGLGFFGMSSLPPKLTRPGRTLNAICEPAACFLNPLIGCPFFARRRNGLRSTAQRPVAAAWTFCMWPRPGSLMP